MSDSVPLVKGPAPGSLLASTAAQGVATLSLPTSLNLVDGGKSNSGVWLTAPQATLHRWEKCPHHAGECPGCGGKVKDDAPEKPKALRVSAALQAKEPALAKSLDKLVDLSGEPDHADLAVGAAQQLFRTLKAKLPRDVADPPRPQPKNILQSIAWLLFGPPKPSAEEAALSDSGRVLKRAMEAHLITQPCFEAGKDLPLEPGKAPVPAETRLKVAAFLIYFAEQLTGGTAAKVA
jgi:hypothetical protein